MFTRFKRYRVQIQFHGRIGGDTKIPSRDMSWHTVDYFWTERAARSHGRLFRLEVWKAKREVWEYRITDRKKPTPPEGT